MPLLIVGFKVRLNDFNAKMLHSEINFCFVPTKFQFRLIPISLLFIISLAIARYTIITFISRLLSVQYAVSQYRYFKEWRKNPQWSFSCCLALLLSFRDLQGDISDLVETDALKYQQHTGDVEMSTILTAVEESKATDFNLQRGDQGDLGDCKIQKCSNKKCHQGTQTELTMLLAIAGGHS